MQVRSASECLRVMSELQQAVQAASDLMLDFTDRSWFVRVMIAPRIAEDAEHVHKLLTVAQQNLDSACMQFLVRHTAGAAAGGGGVGATAVAASQQQEAFAAAQAEMAALVLQLQQLLAAASSEVAGSGDADAESLLQQLHALTGLDADEVAKVTEDAIELLECRQDAAAEAATAGQELPPGGAALLQLRRKQQQGKGRFNLVQPPLLQPEPAPARCMAWVPRRRDKDQDGRVTVVPAHACKPKPTYRIQADEFAGYFYVCGKHKTLFDAYEHTMEQL
eukprot:XP_001700400.1 predicted protein [Chlamydomonas reinhardtii]